MSKLENLNSSKFGQFAENEISNTMQVTGGVPVRTENRTKGCYDTRDDQTGAQNEISDWCDNID